MISYPIQINGVMTRVLQSGLSGDAIVLVHGTGGRADRWTRNLDALAEQGYRVFALDLPGHGLADKSGEFDHSVHGYAAYLAEFIAALGVGKVTLVGTSLGGHVVARCALDHPKLVSRLVLVGSMGLVPVGEDARKRIQNGANNQTRDGIREKLNRVIANPALVTDSFAEEEFLINNSPGAAPSFKRLGEYIFNELDDHVLGESLTNLGLPTLLVWGAEDKTVVPAVGRKARELLPDATLVVISGAAHTAYYEKPEAFNAVIMDFLNGRVGATKLEEVEYS